MKNNFKKLAIIFSFLAITGVSFAAQPSAQDFSPSQVKKLEQPKTGYNQIRHKFYVEGDLGTNFTHSNFDMNDDQNDNDPQYSAFEGIAGNVNFGYQFNPYFALETGLTYMAQERDITENSVLMAHIDAKGIIPISDRFSVFGKLGVSSAVAPTSAAFPFPYAGVGVGYFITPNLQASVQVDGQFFSFWGNNTEFGTVSGGLTYFF